MRSLLLLLMVTLFSCQGHTDISSADPSSLIRINQVGYHPGAVKEFVVADTSASSFRIIREDGKTVLRGTLSDRGTWEPSGESLLSGAFTDLEDPGTYSVLLDNGCVSHPFRIDADIHSSPLTAAIKSFYFQRASMAIEEKYGGEYARASGHPDTACAFHPSSGRSGGFLRSPGGWYDAGDYGKYVVNAAITVAQMASLLELYPGVIPDGRLQIPESGNGIPDLLDEIRYELEWVLTMQDEDGGVFHKLTARNFAGFVMPSDYDLQRLIIGKGTFSSLAFAAVMAQSSRVFQSNDPEFSNRLLASAQRAWQWSSDNPAVPYRNPPDVRTGEYGDDRFEDDFYWAAAELYLTTGDRVYLDHLLNHPEPCIHQETNSWKFFTRNNAFHSLLIHRERIDPGLSSELVKNHLALSDRILEKIQDIPYGVGIDHFEWGSNSDVLNQSMILCIAHNISGKQEYLDGAVRNLDYIFGKNATGYCFLTGFGSKRVMNPHHRPSGADGISDPVPGFILGGPNNDRQDGQNVDYQSDRPAKAFEDVQASYASNEVCLNWNSPAVFVLGYLESVLP